MPNENETLVQVKNLKKYFQTKRGQLHAVDNVSFNIKKGETLGLVGESGCGKSTVGRAIIRLHEPTSGEVLLESNNILKYKTKQEMRNLRRDMQIVFQDPYSSLNPRMNTGQSELEERVMEMMSTVGLEERLANSFPHELDGGRRQRIGIARALIVRPKFIVLDEPVSALDVSIQAQVLNLMDQLQEEFGLTYLFISHDLSVVRHISDRIAVMYLGQIVELANYDQLFRNPLHPYTKALLSAIPIPKYGLNRQRIFLEGDVPSPVNPPSGCRFAGRCKECMENCKEKQVELKEMEPNHFVACHLF